MSGIFTSIRFILALLTVLAIAAKPLIPPKVRTLHPDPTSEVVLYGPNDASGNPVNNWLDADSHFLRCDFDMRHGPNSCGFGLSWEPIEESACPALELNEVNLSSPQANSSAAEVTSCIGKMGDSLDEKNCQTAATPSSKQNLTTAICQTQAARIRSNDFSFSVDASEYDHFRVKIHYEGRAQYLRLVVRNRNPNHLLDGEPLSDKFMSVFMRTEDLRAGPLDIDLKDFSVEEWWVLTFNPPRAMALPEFKHLVMVGIDHVEHGIHRMRVEKIQLIGERISTETYLMILLMLWALFLTVEMSLRFYNLRKSNRQQQEQLHGLVNDTLLLEEQKVVLKKRSMNDPLTGALNRNGLKDHLQHIYGGSTLPAALGLLVLDIDQFKSLNDNYGHDVGDRVLVELAALLLSFTRQNDALTRWGGEEFVLLTENTPHETIKAIAEKLRQQVAKHRFGGELNLRISISIGATCTRINDTFETAFKRADDALYEAKEIRNSVAYDF